MFINSNEHDYLYMMGWLFTKFNKQSRIKIKISNIITKLINRVQEHNSRI